MRKAPIIKNEITRLLTLIDYQILDTPPEAEFDVFIELAAKVCNVPIALISLVDEKRQWFKARLGVDAAETSREISFCAHAVAGNELMIVKDASLDERFSDNPLVTGGPQLKFYAGAPLVAPNGLSIGTLCVADSKPGSLSDDQKVFLTLLSKQVMTLLEYRRALFSMKDTMGKFRNLVQDLGASQNEDKRETLGGLASEVAHEMNNPLAIIMGTVHVLKKLPKEDVTADVLEALLVIESTSKRLAGVVTELQKLEKASAETFANSKSIEQAFSTAVSARNLHLP